ncbi:MAG: thioredoxin domain-containing protein [Pyrinomonadaceae bacterium]
MENRMSNQSSDSHKHTNRLIHESSPYLLKHAHNPVDWHSWSEEAFTKAQAENKPILLSIGYSACHWCNVMERESFESEEIARQMNEHFVNIKVDREERPDVDQIYMNAVQMMLGHGGWPLTVFLTPALVPFYGGTYFPPEDRHNLPAFPRVLRGVAEAYRAQPEEIAETAQNVLKELRRLTETRESNEALSPALLDAAYQGLARNYERRFGGFGGAPKFPAAMNLEFLLRQHQRTGDAKALEMVTHTCRRMAEGGMYDQLGGGFHRYSTDAQWLVPHFEKMLYDNALLSRLYLHVFQVTGDPFFRRVAEHTLDYVVREMTDAQGGFYSAQDADSEGVEGKFFVWSRAEIVRLLGEANADLVAAYYGVTEGGNFEGQNILHLSRPAEEVAEDFNLSVEQFEQKVAKASQILFEARELRIKPGRDEKVLTAWNGMMLASFAEASVILHRPDYLKVAERNAEFLLDTMRRDKKLLHTYKDGQAKLFAYQDDYAQLATGLLSLYEATGNLRWLKAALELTTQMNEEFWDAEAGGYCYTGHSGEQLIVRTKDFFDNATPSGNSVAAALLLRVFVLTENQDYQRQAVTIFRLNRDAMTRYSSAFGCLLGALDFYLSTPKEIVIMGRADSVDVCPLTKEVWKHFLPNKVLVQAGESDLPEAISYLPLLRERPVIDGRATAYVCENYVCQQPVTNAQALARLLQTTAKSAR